MLARSGQCETMSAARRTCLLAVRSLIVVALTWAVVLPASDASASRTAHAAYPQDLQNLMLVRGGTSQTTYIVASFKCRTAPCIALYRTSNHGGNYVQVFLPPLQKVGDLGELVFANASDGFALVDAKGGAHIYVTTNGAKTWYPAPRSTPANVEAVAVSSTDVFVESLRCRTATSCDLGLLARSPLTALKWTSEPLPTAGLNGGGGGLSVYGSTAWLSEQYHNAFIDVTRDGGRTYQRHLENKLDSISGCALTASSSRTLWAECPTGLEVSFFVSNDGGITWTSISDGAVFSGTGGGYFAPVSSDVAFLAQGLNSYDLYRINSGAKVTVVGRLKCVSVNALVFTNTQDGLAICEDPSYRGERLEVTDNAGATWRFVDGY
jgi:hypothetical protein